MRSASLLVVAVLLVVLTGCSSLTLKPADFSWPVEQVVKVDSRGFMNVTRYSFAMNVKPLILEETGDSTNVARWSVRLIRDQRGYYFLTADGFKHVYVFQQADAGLDLEEQILVSEKGLTGAALNQRAPYVELMRDGGPTLLLTADGIAEGGKK